MSDNGPKFFQTRMGIRFFESDFPRLVAAVEKIAERLAAPVLTEPPTRCSCQSCARSLVVMPSVAEAT